MGCRQVGSSWVRSLEPESKLADSSASVAGSTLAEVGKEQERSSWARRSCTEVDCKQEPRKL